MSRVITTTGLLRGRAPRPAVMALAAARLPVRAVALEVQVAPGAGVRAKAR